MEEKERYELFGEHIIKDNDDNAKCQLLDTYKTYVILNQQYKENQQLKQQLEEAENYIEEDEVSKREYYQKVDKNDRFKDKKIKELKQQLAITEKALELAVNFYVSLENSEFARNCRQANIDYFKNKAKEMLENE